MVIMTSYIIYIYFVKSIDIMKIVGSMAMTGKFKNDFLSAGKKVIHSCHIDKIDMDIW